VNATPIVIDSDAELERARALVDKLMASNEQADPVRPEAQAQLIEAYEKKRGPPGRLRTADTVRYLMGESIRYRIAL
jgi:hypothetical protein